MTSIEKNSWLPLMQFIILLRASFCRNLINLPAFVIDLTKGFFFFNILYFCRDGYLRTGLLIGGFLLPGWAFPRSIIAFENFNENRCSSLNLIYRRSFSSPSQTTALELSKNRKEEEVDKSLNQIYVVVGSSTDPRCEASIPPYCCLSLSI